MMGNKAKRRNQALAGFEASVPGADANRIVSVAVDEVKIVEPRRECDLKEIRRIAASMNQDGLNTPITVRFMSDGTSTVPELVVGRYRLEAARLLGWSHIRAVVMGADEIAARRWMHAENFFRVELTVLERSETIDDWRRILRQGAQLAHPVAGGQQPENAAISATARELGITRDEVRRAVQIVGIDPQAKAAAKELGLDDNQAALLEIADEAVARAQLAKVREIAERKSAPRLERRRNAAEPINKVTEESTSTPRTSAEGAQSPSPEVTMDDVRAQYADFLGLPPEEQAKVMHARPADRDQVLAASLIVQSRTAPYPALHRALEAFNEVAEHSPDDTIATVPDDELKATRRQLKQAVRCGKDLIAAIDARREGDGASSADEIGAKPASVAAKTRRTRDHAAIPRCKKARGFGVLRKARTTSSPVPRMGGKRRVLSPEGERDGDRKERGAQRRLKRGFGQRLRG